MVVSGQYKNEIKDHDIPLFDFSAWTIHNNILIGGIMTFSIDKVPISLSPPKVDMDVIIKNCITYSPPPSFVTPALTFSPIKLKIDIDSILKSCILEPEELFCKTSDFRRIFQTSDQMKGEFAKFLNTIFYQLDEKKVFALMEELLADPDKTDEEVYNELLSRIDSTKKKVSFLSKLWSLFVLKIGMGKQVAQLMKGFRNDKFHDYMEIYDRRYIKTIRKAAKLPLDGNVIAVCNHPEVSLTDRIEAGSWLSSYPYKQHVDLNDEDCEDPFLYPEKTYKPISDEVEENSIDLIACLGGLHHIPADRVDDFVESLQSKLRPGAVILLRDHNVTDQTGSADLDRDDLKAIAAVVHAFVNAENGVSWEVESQEVREFKSEEEWTQLMENHGFKRISNESLVLDQDPTENAMFAFIKKPTSLEELKEAISYRNDCTRPKEGTRATWIEWGNVRFSNEYADYIQDHHSYAFDFVGHMRQHWQHFFFFLKECINDKEICFKDVLFSNNMGMNLFILTAATIQCSIGYITSLPSALIARWKHGEDWRNVCNLTELEQFEARNEKEYSEYISHTPFYTYDYIDKVKEMWKVVWNSPENFGTKLASALSAIPRSISFIAKAIVSSSIRAFYTTDVNQEPDTIKMLIKDPHDELKIVIDQWEAEKDLDHDHNSKIEVILETPDGYKLISMPRYKPFTKICGYLSETTDLEILEIGSQQEISIDVLVEKDKKLPEVEGARIVYAMDKLQDEEERSYVTYQVNLSALKQFQQAIEVENIEYIHE